MTDDTKEGTADRPSSEAAMFGRIALKNQLVGEADLRRVMSSLTGGSDLGKALVAEGLISAKHAEAISQKVSQRLEGQSTAASAGDAGSPAQATARGGVVSIDDVKRMDFTSMVGKPLIEYLRKARELGCSDFHFQVDSAPLVRLHGHLIRWKHPVLTVKDTARTIEELLDEKQWKDLQQEQDLDYCLDDGDRGRYRTNCFKQRKGFEAVFRIIPTKVPSFEDLHLPEVLSQFTQYNQGIVLVTGPAGCGKSATLAAIVERINQQRHDHIVTVEDPIEYIFTPAGCNINQRHVHHHTETNYSALRSAMRADPDVIMVGEMRDVETISMAITAAETGHLVLATLHTTNAIRSIDRLIDVFPPREQEQVRAMVSESMRGVISQQLLPRKDGTGVEPALEIMFTTPAVGNLIREGKTYQLASVLQTGRKQGMITMDDSIRILLRKGIVTPETARFHAEDPSAMQG
ncbi:MAG: PilT/PilU family type 4a pilus ATPase [Planctomycetota bacterium]|jgi:twitching motility protein PilT|nr:PilT/PilU family type 4a pilus ATPase [Planctomycetota bacterium]